MMNVIKRESWGGECKALEGEMGEVQSMQEELAFSRRWAFLY